ncbi:MAG: multiubiquitin domain-containing protein [Algibacter sp.]|uniref:multiubiquitin domain-containing protein n=1 Tax=Algibacter sp. TaxID=1872428 RepID=UPI00260D96F1|nr:multiubiquitin domain-containing protein [Algibacter sp.]MDG1729900.1 multiubiquitin domain-containing protein [Algibacter sp.]MDG2179152.1 multiubiquitin domain-containing protein [Algibacter sp.]
MDKFIFKVNRQKFESVNAIITGKEVLGIASLLPVEDYELLIKVNEKGFEPVQLDEKIDLKGAGIEGFFAKPYKKLLIYVDDEPVEVDECFMTPNEILTAAGKNANGFYLKQISGHKEVSYKNDREHKVAIKNGLKFSSCKLEPTTVS